MPCTRAAVPILTMAMLVAACSGATSSPGLTVMSTPPAPPATTQGSQPSPSGLAMIQEGVALTPGRYATRFQPGFSLVVVRGEFDVSGTTFINYSFGHDPGNDFFVNRVDKVPDLKHPGSLIDPPADLIGWLAAVPGRKLLDGPTHVTAGGLDAQQIDVLSGSTDDEWPMPDADSTTQIPAGLPANRTARMILIDVHGQRVLIMFLVQEAGTAHRSAALEVFEPMVDSIVWQ
jgi:hypothetical protein